MMAQTQAIDSLQRKISDLSRRQPQNKNELLIIDKQMRIQKWIEQRNQEKGLDGKQESEE